MAKPTDRSQLERKEKRHNLRMLIFEDRLTGKILYGAYMSVESNVTQVPPDLHYKNVGKFNGTILFYDLKGIFGNGCIYNQGKPTQQIARGSEQQSSQLLKQRKQNKSMTTGGTQCNTAMAENFVWGCVQVGNSTANCGWVSTGYHPITVCTYVDYIAPDDGNDGWSGSGGNYYAPDCAGMPGGTAIWIEDCKTCIGGITGLTACARLLKEIKIDSNARPCVDTSATKIISEAGEIQNVLSDLLSMANLNASAAISHLSSLNNHKIVISEFYRSDKNIYDSNGNLISSCRTNGITDSIRNIGLNKVMLNEATDLAFASTIIHELMHSYMVYGIKNTIGMEHDVFIQMNNLLFNKDRVPLSNQNVAQHAQMATTYINSMASLLHRYATSRGILQSPDGSISLMDYCKDIFWHNLAETQSAIAAPNPTRAKSNGKREASNSSNSTKKKIVNMRSFILIIFVIFIIKISKAQTVKYSGEDNMQLYSLAINNLIKTSPHEKFFPKSLLISGGTLSYLSDFLSEPTEANNVKKYIVENNWDYFSTIDIKKYNRKSEELKIKCLKPILATDQLIKKNLPFYYTFSPIIFSQDGNRGILVFVRHGKTETSSILIYYFIRNQGVWHLANVQMPYLI